MTQIVKSMILNSSLAIANFSGGNLHTANIYCHPAAKLPPEGCIVLWITAIDSALSLTVIHYSQTTANVQLMTALIAKSDNN